MLLDAVSGFCKWSGLALVGIFLLFTTPVAFCVLTISRPIDSIHLRRWHFWSDMNYSTSTFRWIRQFQKYSHVPVLWKKHITSDKSTAPAPAAFDCRHTTVVSWQCHRHWWFYVGTTLLVPIETTKVVATSSTRERTNSRSENANNE